MHSDVLRQIVDSKFKGENTETLEAVLGHMLCVSTPINTESEEDMGPTNEVLEEFDRNENMVSAVAAALYGDDEGFDGSFAVRNGYEELFEVLIDALNQSQHGKGAERHQRDNEGFLDQPIMLLTEKYGEGFPLGQADKKMEESLRLAPDAAVNELLGAIVYIAAAIIYLRLQDQ